MRVTCLEAATDGFSITHMHSLLAGSHAELIALLRGRPQFTNLGRQCLRLAWLDKAFVHAVVDDVFQRSNPGCNHGPGLDHGFDGNQAEGLVPNAGNDDES